MGDVDTYLGLTLALAAQYHIGIVPLEEALLRRGYVRLIRLRLGVLNLSEDAALEMIGEGPRWLTDFEQEGPVGDIPWVKAWGLLDALGLPAGLVLEGLSRASVHLDPVEGDERLGGR